MIDIRLLRNDLDLVKKSISRRGENTEVLDQIIELDLRQRQSAEKRDEIRNEIK